MSVAQYQMPGAAVAGAGWSPNFGVPNMSAPTNSGYDNMRTPFASVQTNDLSRGDLSGDVCLAFDLFSNSDEIITAQWSEESCQCFETALKSAKVISYNDNGREQLKSWDNSSSKICDDSSDISVGDPRSEHDERYYPLQYLCNSYLSDLSPEVDLSPEGTVSLAKSVSLIFAHGLNLQRQMCPSGEVNVSTLEKRKKKGQKGRKEKSQSITLISPVGFTQIQRAVLIAAADHANLRVKNIFNRAVAAVAGGLYVSSRESGQGLLGALQATDVRGGFSPPQVLYLNVFKLNGSVGVFYDIALVQCEGSDGAQNVGAKLGFERLCTVASQGGPLCASDDSCPAEHLRRAIDRFLPTADAKSEIKVLVLDGLLVHSQKRQKLVHGVHAESLGLPTTTYVHEAGISDAAVGGSVLSAAELESSKQYLQLDTGEWRIAHLLPVADGVLEGSTLAVRVQWDQQQADAHSAHDTANENTGHLEGASVVFQVGTRIWKEDFGRIRPGSLEQLAPSNFRQDFKWGAAVQVDGCRSVVPAIGWPRVQILQKEMNGSNWLVLKTLTPLLNVAATEDLSPVSTKAGEHNEAKAVQSCSLEVRIDPATGSVGAVQTKGSHVVAMTSVLWSYTQLALVILVPCMLIALFYFSGFVVEWYATRQHTAWLEDFYLKNAPEKLNDPGYIARTVTKYKGRMFLLWRGLERTYKVKWHPPHSILDTGSKGDEF